MTAKKDIGNVDAALQKLGPFKRYTLVQFSMQILSQFAVATHTLSIVFTGQKNPFRCPESSSVNGSDLESRTSNLYKTNSSFVNASQPEYDSVCRTVPQSEGGTTQNMSQCQANNMEYQLPKNIFFVSEFDLICDREFLAGITQTLLTLGLAVGSIFFPYFADNYGRKPVLLFCSFMWLGSSVGLAFSVNYTMLAVLKAFVGVFLQGVSQTAVTVMTEILTGRQRGHMFGSLAFIFWTLSIMLMVPVAYLLRHHSWRILELAYCSYFVYIILYLLLMDESLRWLAANGMKERVMDVLKRASRWNGSNFDEVVSAFYEGHETEISKHSEAEIYKTSDTKSQSDNSVEKSKEDTSTMENVVKSGTLKDQVLAHENLNCWSLFSNKLLRNSTLFSLFAWFFNSLTYYALFLMSSTLSGSLYLNYFLNSVVEIPSAIFLYFFIDRLGRKVCFAAFSIIAGTALLGAAVVSALFSDQIIAIKVLTILGKFGISGSFGVIYAYTPELFPTNVRTTGLGLANMSACLGGMLAPFAEMLMHKVVYAPGLIFGISSLILSAWTFFLPETARRQLPQSIMDIKKWSQEHKNGKKVLKNSDISDTNSYINAAFTEV